METITFEGWEHVEHQKGSLNCTAGLCNSDDGYCKQVVPLPCSCGGVIHGAWEPSSINLTYGPYDMFACDNCKKEYGFDEVVAIKKVLTAGKGEFEQLFTVEQRQELVNRYVEITDREGEYLVCSKGFLWDASGVSDKNFADTCKRLGIKLPNED